MSSPIGHCLASFAFCGYRTDARSIRLLICAQVAGLAPDIDILLGMFMNAEWTARVYQSTHNVFFPMLLAVPLAMISGRNLRSWLFFSSMGWLHCLFDALIGWPLFSGPTRGVPFFYPFHSDFVAGSIALIPPVFSDLDARQWELRSLFALAYEIVLFTALNVFVWVKRLLGYNRISPNSRRQFGSKRREP